MDNALLLKVLLFAPLLIALIIAVNPTKDDKDARGLALFGSWVMFVLSIVIGCGLDKNYAGLQMVTVHKWITSPFPINFHIGVDGMSMSLVLLTTLVTLMAVYASYSIKQRVKLYYANVMLLTFSLLGVFMSQDLLQFFVMYEFELVPMYFLIAIWGGPRRSYAAMKFLLYTFFGGVLMLAGLLYTYTQLYAMDPATATFNMPQLAASTHALPVQAQVIACLGFFLAFIIKLPSVPFHTWLPDAHVEAPTPISMILAGLLLKMGSYGLVRICMGFFPAFFAEYAPWVIALGAFNIMWGAIACLVQKDMKRIIAFSSISHMGFILLAIGTLSNAAVNGAIFQMLSHGLISALLFFLVGCIYERCHTRLLPEIGGGLAYEMPILYYFWMFGVMANLGLPALSGFVGEVTVFYGSFMSPLSMSALYGAWTQGWIVAAALSVVLTAGYMLWLFKRLFYGPLLPKWAGHLYDVSATEKFVGAVLCVLILVFGIAPFYLTDMFGRVGDRITADCLHRVEISELNKPNQNM